MKTDICNIPLMPQKQQLKFSQYLLLFTTAITLWTVTVVTSIIWLLWHLSVGGIHWVVFSDLVEWSCFLPSLLPNWERHKHKHKEESVQIISVQPILDHLLQWLMTVNVMGYWQHILMQTIFQIILGKLWFETKWPSVDMSPVSAIQNVGCVFEPSIFQHQVRTWCWSLPLIQMDQFWETS